jgi:SAM-dependent methyltransferase
LKAEIRFDHDDVVADIGSGTGVLSELFLENGNTVFCVEPNRDMRLTVEERLRNYVPRFVSTDGRAEATNLEAKSVDLISVGQALHWFDLAETRVEFRRILKREGHITVIHNYRREESEVEKACARLASTCDRNRVPVPYVDDAYVAKFLGNDDFRKFVMPNSQTLDLEGLLGRLASASHMPIWGSKEWVKVQNDASAILREHGSKGKVTLRYDTTMYLGAISQPRT